MNAPASPYPMATSAGGSEPLLAPDTGSNHDAAALRRPPMTRTLLLVTLCLTLIGCGSDEAAPTEGDTSVMTADSSVESGDATQGSGEEDTSPAPATEDVPPVTEPEPEPPTCNPISNTGCEEGQKCGYGTTGAKLCVPAGDTPGGDPCQSDAECAGGSTCTSLNGEDYYCYIFCKTIGHCPNNAACLEITDAAFSLCKIEGIYDNCNILAQDCEQGKGCYSIGGEDLPVCLEAGAEPVGGVCESPSDCSPGHHCVNFRCYELCDKNDPNACGTFTSCAGFVAAGVGYCDEQQ